MTITVTQSSPYITSVEVHSPSPGVDVVRFRFDHFKPGLGFNGTPTGTGCEWFFGDIDTPGVEGFHVATVRIDGLDIRGRGVTAQLEENYADVVIHPAVDWDRPGVEWRADA